MSDSLRRQISTPASLFVFETVARHGSFRSAGVELNITQPSVSYQIANLEKHLGVRLFERRGRNIALTEEGDILYKAVQRGFASIQAGLAEISHRASENLVTFCLSSSAAANFVLPRYARLRERLPHIDLSIKIISHDINPASENGDFAIRLGHGKWDDLDCWYLFDEVYFPVCAPNYFANHKGPVTLDVIKSSDLLFLKELFRERDDWRVFFDRIGSPLTATHERITFSDQQALLATAMAGQGVAMGWLGMADNLLETQALIRPLDVEAKSGRSFYIVAPKGVRLTKTATEFRDWMIGQGAEVQARWEASHKKTSQKRG